MTEQSDGAVRHDVVVDVLLDEAFWRFADPDRMTPRGHITVPVAETVLEQREGGDVVDGSTCRWDRVLTSAPPHIERHGDGRGSLPAGLDAPEGGPLYRGGYGALVRAGLDR